MTKAWFKRVVAEPWVGEGRQRPRRVAKPGWMRTVTALITPPTIPPSRGEERCRLLFRRWVYRGPCYSGLIHAMTNYLGSRRGFRFVPAAGPFLLCSVLTLAASPGPVPAEDPQPSPADDVAALRSRISDLTADLVACRADKKRAEARADALGEKLEQACADIEALSAKLDAATREGARQAVSIEKLRSSLAAQEKAAAAAREARAALEKEIAESRATIETVPALRRDLEEKTKRVAETSREMSLACVERQDLRDRVAQLSHDIEAARNKAAERIEDLTASANRTIARERLWIVLELILIFALAGTIAKLWLGRKKEAEAEVEAWESPPICHDPVARKIPIGRLDASGDSARSRGADPASDLAAPPSLPAGADAGAGPPSGKQSETSDGADAAEDLAETFRSVVDKRFDRIVRRDGA